MENLGLNRIVRKRWLNKETVLMDIYNPIVAKSALPGHFVIVKMDEKGERIPLTVADYDKEAGTVTIIVHVIGRTTQILSTFNEGESFDDFVGPLGQKSEFIDLVDDLLKDKKILFVAGGVGVAPIYPQIKWWASKGMKQDVIVGARTKELILMEDSLRNVANNLFITTDDGSLGEKGLVTNLIQRRVEEDHVEYDAIVAIGPMIMMKFVCELTRKYNIKTIVSLNSLMIDGTGMCGACRVDIGGKMKFTCVDGPEFDGHLVDFDEAMQRQGMFKTPRGRKIIEAKEEFDKHKCKLDSTPNTTLDKKKRVPVRELTPESRIHTFDEVCLGYDLDEAISEANRCIQCKNPKCVTKCPVNVRIPDFIKALKEGDLDKSAEIIALDSILPAICGRVCPQESQCEGACVLGVKSEAVAVGKLERFVADWARVNKKSILKKSTPIPVKVAVIGSGPAGLSCAGELAQLGYEVTLMEALHKAGGVLTYGIPDFRLPKDIVKYEIDQVRKLGVKIKTNVVVGKTITIEELMNEKGYKAVFIGSGAGLPRFMQIKGENLNGVLSANEFLTRNILMHAYKEDYETPIYVGHKVVVVGGGNVAMDAARTARRLGADVSVIYRRTEEELPARKEEVHHAKEEGINFVLLTNPVEILPNEQGWVGGLKCVKMSLGEPDESGRRSSTEIPNSEYVVEADTVIISIGTSPNPMIAETTEGLALNKSKGVDVADASGETNLLGVFAGGDAVMGSATVILAMGAGKKAALAMHDYLLNLQ
jgi:glutamate synthase (NADPH) small chain